MLGGKRCLFPLSREKNLVNSMIVANYTLIHKVVFKITNHITNFIYHIDTTRTVLKKCRIFNNDIYSRQLKNKFE